MSCAVSGLLPINLSLFDANSPRSTPIILKDILVGQQQDNDMTEVDISMVPSDYKFGACYLNHEDLAYASIRFDQQSLDWLFAHLNQV